MDEMDTWAENIVLLYEKEKDVGFYDNDTFGEEELLMLYLAAKKWVNR